MDLLSPGSLFFLPLSHNVVGKKREWERCCIWLWGGGGGVSSLPFCGVLPAGQSLPLGLHRQTCQSHTGYKHTSIFITWIPAAITDTSFCLSRSCCCCCHNVRSSISASACREHFIISISFRNCIPHISLQLFLLKIKIQLSEDCLKLQTRCTEDVQMLPPDR